MAHGAPDYSNVLKSGQVYRLDDMAELAARLGSIVTYDRRGDVLYIESFKNGLNGLLTQTVGDNSVISLTTDMLFTYPCSAKLHTGENVSDLSSIYKYLAIPKNPKIGNACLINFGAAIDEFYTNIYYDDGSKQWYTYLLFNFSDDTLKVRTDDGLVTLIDNLPDLRGYYVWNFVKIVADLNTKKLIRAIFNNSEYDLSEYTMPSGVLSEIEKLSVRYTNLNNQANQTNVYIDSFIITTNEE